MSTRVNATLNTLSRRMNGLHDRIKAEQDVELPQERVDAGGDTALIANVDARETELYKAVELYAQAIEQWNAAASARDINPKGDGAYAQCLRLVTRVQQIVDEVDTPAPATDDDGDNPAPKPTNPKGKGGKGGDSPAPVPAPDSDEEEGEDDEDKKEKDGDSPTDPVLAAIAEFREECRTGNTKLRKELAELAKGTLPEELAAILKDLDPEAAKIIVTLNVDHLNAMLNSTLSPQAAAALTKLAAYPDEELQTMLANLAAMSKGAERVRKVIPRRKKGEDGKKDKQ